MTKSFEMKYEDLKKLEKLFRKSPKLLKPVSANVLNSLAFMTRGNDIKNISRHMIIRSQKFVESSIRVTKSKSSADINKQKAFVFSVRRPRFTGWEEQQTGKAPTKKRSVTLDARRGSKRNKVQSKYRMRSKNKFYKPAQFQGKSLQQRFYFMLRVLGTRGGGEFLINNEIKLKKGTLRKGLYSFKKHKISKIQDLTKGLRAKRFQWRTLSLKQLQSNNDIAKIWNKSFKYIISRSRLKK